MEILFAFSGWHYLYSIPLSIVSLFLILVVLVQRGRGGGLTGALGGMGGQSAFGTKAGDLFTKITIVVAAVWILLSMLAIQRLGRPSAARRSPPPATVPAKPGETTAPAGKKSADLEKNGGKADGGAKSAGNAAKAGAAGTTDKGKE